MTFRHTKFEDSQVMRSLEKIAVEKGLVKPAPAKSIHKTASNNLVPSGNFTQDIIKLCAGLRSNGFNKYAEEIESKFLMFKQADTLYQTSKETGEDLIDAAHPEGSHKLDGLDHTVLTIVDRQKRIQEILNKRPTGKLATNKEILNAVKIALAETADLEVPEGFDTDRSAREADEAQEAKNKELSALKSRESRLLANRNKLINDAYDAYKSLEEYANKHTTFSGMTSAKKAFAECRNEQGGIIDEKVSSNVLNEILTQLEKDYYEIGPGGIRGFSENDPEWRVIRKAYPQVRGFIQNALRAHSDYFQNNKKISELTLNNSDNNDGGDLVENAPEYTNPDKDLIKTEVAILIKESQRLWNILNKISELRLPNVVTKNIVLLRKHIQFAVTNYRYNDDNIKKWKNTLKTVRSHIDSMRRSTDIPNIAKTLQDMETGDTVNSSQLLVPLSTPAPATSPGGAAASVAAPVVAAESQEITEGLGPDPSLTATTAAAVTNGLFRSNTLNAIKALKISLGADSPEQEVINLFKSDQSKLVTDYNGFFNHNNILYKLYNSQNNYLVNWTPVYKRIQESVSKLKPYLIRMSKLIKSDNSNWDSAFAGSDDTVDTIHTEMIAIIDGISSTYTVNDLDPVLQNRDALWQLFKNTEFGAWVNTNQDKIIQFNLWNDQAINLIYKIRSEIGYYNEHKYDESGELLSAVPVTNTNPRADFSTGKKDSDAKVAETDTINKIKEKKTAILIILNEMEKAGYDKVKIGEARDWVSSNRPQDAAELSRLANYKIKIKGAFETFKDSRSTK